ncbi:OmpA family protein [Roseovarius sp. SCSIO 43702]|uniref:OmpA family protein n=1 Tax=Roseovarius sp. SCSIO 43702 TaxID=2823043 RepID=UPI001C735762|nr:OmpA family protein [Roseovarius sp. SCSIO 43702]QYX57064.1 OmpA family protein [Roseovarius sp. SCSIO 43702]
MRLSSIVVIGGTFFVAALLAVIAAGFSAGVIEKGSKTEVRRALDLADIGWAEVDADGLQVFIAGTAPTEASRFKAISVAGGVVDSTRVIDQMQVEDAAEIAPPRFSLEILRNDAGVSLIGLIPADADSEALFETVERVAEGASVTDFIDRADYPIPDGWNEAVRYAGSKLDKLPRAKISIEAGRVSFTATTDSPREKRELEAELSRRVPRGIRVVTDISAPRPVITPFTLRFLIEDGAARFDACSADTEKARREILAAAREAGASGDADCTIGLGVPTPHWSEAARLGIEAVSNLGGGTITFSDADISLVAPEGADQALFDDVVGTLETELPEVFALHAVLPPPPTDAEPVVPEFVATLSPEGLVQMRGRVGSEKLRQTVDSFARARFSSDGVYIKARVVEGLPSDWPVRVLAGLEALSYLTNGAVTVTPETIKIHGDTGNKEASAKIAGFFSETLSESAQYDIEVRYKEALDPIAALPTPEECIRRLNLITAERKINFEPGSDTFDASGADIMNDIAELLKQCGEINIEIGGHTDSQGREVMNEQLSEDRAMAVLEALRARRVITSNITAVGYGESQPIADNETEEGREANRRIEFKLLEPEATAERETGLESLEQDSEEESEEASGQNGTEDEQN